MVIEEFNLVISNGILYSKNVLKHSLGIKLTHSTLCVLSLAA